MATVLMIGTTAGCAKKIEYVWLKSDCRVPELITEDDLPGVDVDAIYDALEAYHGTQEGRKMAEDLRARERLILDNLFEHRAIVIKVCERAGED